MHCKILGSYLQNRVQCLKATACSNVLPMFIRTTALRKILSIQASVTVGCFKTQCLARCRACKFSFTQRKNNTWILRKHVRILTDTAQVNLGTPQTGLQQHCNKCSSVNWKHFFFFMFSRTTETLWSVIWNRTLHIKAHFLGNIATKIKRNGSLLQLKTLFAEMLHKQSNVWSRCPSIRPDNQAFHYLYHVSSKGL